MVHVAACRAWDGGGSIWGIAEGLTAADGEIKARVCNGAPEMGGNESKVIN